MFTVEEFKEKTETAIAAYRSLLSIAGDERKELGQPKENTIIYFNTLYYAMKEAYNALNTGLEGKFPWDKEEKENE